MSKPPRGKAVKAGQAAARQRGVPIGRRATTLPPDLEAKVRELYHQGRSLQQIADALTAAGVPTLSGAGATWARSSVQLLIRRLGLDDPPDQGQGG